MSVRDILLSLRYATLNSNVLSDVIYWVRNARGNQATYSVQDFVLLSGMAINIFYMCSLNLYCLAVVRYNKIDSYIHTKIEPFLHGVPIIWGFIFATIALVNQNFNNHERKTCYALEYDPPH